jgi:IS30 family transposase
MSTYTHLTREERYHIETMRKQKISLNAIAKGMGRNKETVKVLSKITKNRKKYAVRH